MTYKRQRKPLGPDYEHQRPVVKTATVSTELTANAWLQLDSLNVQIQGLPIINQSTKPLTSGGYTCLFVSWTVRNRRTDRDTIYTVQQYSIPTFCIVYNISNKQFTGLQ